MSPRIGIDGTAVLMAAVDVANTEGLEAVTITSVAKKLGIRPPSLYNHVNGLDQIRVELAKYALDRLYEHISAAVGEREGEAAIRGFAEAYLEFAHAYPGLYDAAQAAPGPEHPSLQEAGKQLVDLILRYLGSYPLTEEQALHAVRGLRSLIHGFASLERRGAFGLPLGLKDSLQFNLGLFLGGLNQIAQTRG
ncbi:TetR/AcrR family transcriptional regulator [Paenibacillus rubinfantis]|uniref:TetR/AcrR family transcriptional regulator n=1 Tax=Paenibacillus rubinfantis TaxID=1720296 RepID=UPI00073F774E|nr:TetR/AcrR family transcriptional regulator [Paenibacillus rubinfantis]